MLLLLQILKEFSLLTLLFQVSFELIFLIIFNLFEKSKSSVSF